MRKLVITAWLLSVLAFIYCDSDCIVHETDPCVCLTTSSSTTTCEGVSTVAKLKEHFAGKGTTTLDTITIINSDKLTSLSSDIFGSVKYKNLVIGKTGLSSVDDATFQGSKDILETIILNSNSFTQFNFKSIKNLNKLNGFRVSNDGLTQLPKDAFPALPQLLHIDLANNSIATLHKETFENLARPDNIDLSQNKLTTVGEGVFSLPNALNRVTINLKANKITSFHKDAFKGIKLKNLDLDDNKLETLEKDVFEPLLTYLVGLGIEHGTIHTKGNPFKCDTSILWLVKKPSSYKQRVSNFKCKESGKRLNQLTEDDLN